MRCVCESDEYGPFVYVHDGPHAYRWRRFVKRLLEAFSYKIFLKDNIGHFCTRDSATIVIDMLFHCFD